MYKLIWIMAGAISLITELGVVQAEASAFSDEANTCCDKIRYPSQGFSELLQECKSRGGHNVKRERFVDSAYCETHRSPPNKGWKYYCTKLVEADCVQYP